jgi:hypothetical protein
VKKDDGGAIRTELRVADVQDAGVNLFERADEPVSDRGDGWRGCRGCLGGRGFCRSRHGQLRSGGHRRRCAQELSAASIESMGHGVSPNTDMHESRGVT